MHIQKRSSLLVVVHFLILGYLCCAAYNAPSKYLSYENDDTCFESELKLLEYACSNELDNDLYIKDAIECITGYRNYTKNYNAFDTCQKKHRYNVTIYKDDSNKQFIIDNFGSFQSPEARVTCKITSVEVNNSGEIKNVKWIIPNHIDTDSDGDRIITSSMTPGSTNHYLGNWNASTGVLSITWNVTFFDGTKDQCTLTLTPF